MHGLLPQDLEGWLQALRSTGQVSSWSYGMFVKIRGSSAGWAKGVKLQDKNLHAYYTPFSLQISLIDREWSSLVRTIQVWRRLELVASTYGQKSMDACAHHAHKACKQTCASGQTLYINIHALRAQAGTYTLQTTHATHVPMLQPLRPMRGT